VRAAWNAWREHRAADRPDRTADTRSGPVPSPSRLTLTNGGDNIGVYVPVFHLGSSQLVIYAVVFLALVALWRATGWALTAGGPGQVPSLALQRGGDVSRDLLRAHGDWAPTNWARTAGPWTQRGHY
jgi:hypothetical protein